MANAPGWEVAVARAERGDQRLPDQREREVPSADDVDDALRLRAQLRPRRLQRERRRDWLRLDEFCARGGSAGSGT